MGDGLLLLLLLLLLMGFSPSLQNFPNNFLKNNISQRFALFQIPSHHPSSALFVTCDETQEHSGHCPYLDTVSGCIIGTVDVARPSQPRPARS